MRLINGNKSAENEIFRAPERMSLDELFEVASTYGKLQTGSFSSNIKAELHLNFTEKDYVTVYGETQNTLKGNIALCIKKAEAYRRFYEEQRWS